MLELIFKYVVGAIGRLPLVRRYESYAKRKLARLQRHPVYLLPIVALVFGIVIFNPEFLPEAVRPGRTCYMIEPDKVQIDTETADSLFTGGARPCLVRSIVAIEWYNWTPLSGHGDKGFVMANVFLSGSAADIPNKENWFEYNVFGRSNRFIYTYNNSFEDSFLKGACGFDDADSSILANIEGRRGVLLTTAEARSDPSLPRDKWEWCNHGSPTDIRYSSCGYRYYQVLIPNQMPENWYPSQTWVNRWHWTGTIKRYLSLASDPDLRGAAQSRWRPGKELEVSDAQWKKWTNAMPPLCIRPVGLDGKPLGGRATWGELGRIAAVWYDK